MARPPHTLSRLNKSSHSLSVSVTADRRVFLLRCPCCRPAVDVLNLSFASRLSSSTVSLPTSYCKSTPSRSSTSMAASVAPRRAPTFPPTAPADEEFINRSLLDSLDAQADAEPLSSSDSEANPPPATSFAMSSVVGAR